MIIVMSPAAAQTEIDNVVARVTGAGLKVHLSEGKVRTIIGLIGEKKLMAQLPLEAMPGVEKTIAVTAGYKLVSREFKNEDTVIDIGGILVGGANLVVMAGPCAVESKEQLLESAKIVKAAGAQFLRGGLISPGLRPTLFRGWKRKDWSYWRRLRL